MNNYQFNVLSTNYHFLPKSAWVYSVWKANCISTGCCLCSCVFKPNYHPLSLPDSLPSFFSPCNPTSQFSGANTHTKSRICYHGVNIRNNSGEINMNSMKGSFYGNTTSCICGQGIQEKKGQIAWSMWTWQEDWCQEKCWFQKHRKMAWGQR